MPSTARSVARSPELTSAALLPGAAARPAGAPSRKSPLVIAARVASCRAMTASRSGAAGSAAVSRPHAGSTTSKEM